MYEYINFLPIAMLTSFRRMSYSFFKAAVASSNFYYASSSVAEAVSGSTLLLNYLDYTKSLLRVFEVPMAGSNLMSESETDS